MTRGSLWSRDRLADPADLRDVAPIRAKFARNRVCGLATRKSVALLVMVILPFVAVILAVRLRENPMSLP
jgi:hypothetical protein